MIYYNQDTRACISHDFIPLDNCKPKRPELFEIEPILRFITDSELENDSFYGFFSPRLFEKTGLSSDDIFPIDEDTFKKHDVVSISPHPISGRWLKNPIHQGKQHGGFRWRFDCLVSEAKISTSEIQEEFIYGTPNPEYFLYSHYFWATGKFWKKWAEKIQNILEMESSDNTFRAIINSRCSYKETNQYNYLVFLLERVAGLLAFSNKSPVAEYALRKRILHDAQHLGHLPTYLAPVGRALYFSEMFFLGEFRFPSLSHAFIIKLSNWWPAIDLTVRKILKKAPPDLPKK